LIPAIGVTAANIIGGLIVTGLLIGASMLLSPKPKKLTATTATSAGGSAAKQSSYSFSGPENTTVQGAAVPCLYGRSWVGSVVISASIDTTDY
jgi:predicted phage tail protein